MKTLAESLPKARRAMNKVALVVLTLIPVPMLAQQVAKYSWFDPPDELMLAHARRGYDGDKAEPVEIYKTTREHCADWVLSVSLMTPVAWAEALGSKNRQRFDPSPTVSQLLEYKSSADLYVTYGSAARDDDVGVAVKQGERIYKAANIKEPSLAESCHSLSGSMYWIHTANASFRGKGALPGEGAARLLIRRSSADDEQFEINFSQLPSADNAPIYVDAKVQATKLLFAPKPEYPPLAEMARIQGSVRFEALVSKIGVVEDLKLIEGHPLLVKAAFEAVMRRRYKPTEINGQTVEVRTIIEVSFASQ